jgi:hypothetical protein
MGIDGCLAISLVGMMRSDPNPPPGIARRGTLRRSLPAWLVATGGDAALAMDLIVAV